MLQKLGQKAIGNAKTYYLLGQSLKQLGLFKDAKVILYKAQAYDCSLWRGNIIFNKVLITEAERNAIDVIDFNAIVNSNFGKNILFEDEIFPQAIYYEELTKEIIKKVKIYFDLKETRKEKL
jgi:tetratricopeptide (TPR) repeat protein